MNITERELNFLLTEARRDAGNEAVRLKLQLAEEVDGHAKTAKELQAQIAELKAENETLNKALKRPMVEPKYLRIAQLEEDLQIEKNVHADTCRQKNARIAELEKERDRYKKLHLDELKDSNVKTDEYAVLSKRLETIKAENASLRADAGYWRALKNYAALNTGVDFRIEFNRGAVIFAYGSALSRPYENLSRMIELITGYKPEATNEG